MNQRQNNLYVTVEIMECSYPPDIFWAGWQTQFLKARVLTLILAGLAPNSGWVLYGKPFPFLYFSQWLIHCLGVPPGQKA
jgi:hypothetical protein